ncbi:hypothetical protein QTN25_001701 [Entamoeba marina]
MTIQEFKNSFNRLIPMVVVDRYFQPILQNAGQITQESVIGIYENIKKSSIQQNTTITQYVDVHSRNATYRYIYNATKNEWEDCGSPNIMLAGLRGVNYELYCVNYAYGSKDEIRNELNRQ